jgi:hypothetical protein
VWAHPDLLPDAADLDDPLGFREGMPDVEDLSDEDFDKALGELLDGADTPTDSEDSERSEDADGPDDGGRPGPDAPA